jgi:hypothetical protein
MKKMNKMYEAPIAEMLEIEAVNVMMVSGGTGQGQNPPTGGTPGTPGTGPSLS